MKREGGWHRSVTGVLRRTLEAAVEDNIPFLASALSFDVLLTAIPFFALILAAIGYLVQHQLAVHQVEVHELIQQFLPSAGGDQGAFQRLEGALSDLVRQRERLTLFGVPAFLWFSTRLFGGLRVALNEVFDTDESRPWPLAKLTDLGMVLVTGGLLVVNAYLLAVGARVEAALGGGFMREWLFRFSIELMAVASSALLFFVIFKLLPSRRIHWRTALIAAGFCALAFEIAKRLYTLYLTRFATLDRIVSDANVVGFILFLLWIYYSAYVFLLGGEVAETYDLIRMRRSQRVGLG
ncbi:MAG: YihY/virulence factor BrkB family protein [Gemmatimonadetes bacterium]|nr:YihY/virulence factor BrkB family protein [Gemmatimonadota bacterium]